jgi:predicted enzyme related to lactoylglutathione lyase
MPVNGVGGLFFRSRDPKALREWYKRHLGLGFGWQTEAGPTVFAPFAHDTDYFPADRGWMLNLRVSDLDALLDELRGAGIEVVTKPEWDTEQTGRFARIHDPEGNPVELWQPPAE